MLLLGAFGVAGHCHPGMVGAADPPGIQEIPGEEMLEKEHPELSVLAWRHLGMMGCPLWVPSELPLLGSSGWEERGAGGHPGKGGEKSLEQTAGNCFSFVCCSGEGSRAEKCILLI